MKARLSLGKPKWWFIRGFMFSSFLAACGLLPAFSADRLPVRGLHLTTPAKKDTAALAEFIRNVLPKEGVNTLVIEFDYSFNFQSRPEFSDASAIGKEEVKQIASACREKKIQLIPQINCLGHQSWAKRTGRLLEKHPEFDETPGKYPENKDIYCRSYCPLHPEVHAVLFELIDELAAACDATAFHVGMDEVFILADPDCPRCKSKTTAEVFAKEVTTLHDHLKTKGWRMWMWGDRFLDGKALNLGKWEGSENGTAAAIDLVPKDIVICDWHYDAAVVTPLVFATNGFDVVVCPWRKPAVALAELDQLRTMRSGKDQAAARHALGMIQTTWGGFAGFAKAYEQQKAGAAPEKSGGSQAANCFIRLFEVMREDR